jgi:hypothetical protein
MGIRFSCPSGHKLNVKTFLAGKRGVCPQCGARFVIPVPAQLQTSDVGQTLAVTNAQTVEAITPSAVQTTAVAASPSVIIQVADTAALHDDASGQIVSEKPIENVLLTPVAPVAAAPATQSFVRPRSQRQIQIVVSALLFVLVIVLAIVLFIVMHRQLSQQPAPKKKSAAATHLERPAPNWYAVG